MQKKNKSLASHPQPDESRFVLYDANIDSKTSGVLVLDFVVEVRDNKGNVIHYFFFYYNLSPRLLFFEKFPFRSY